MLHNQAVKKKVCTEYTWEEAHAALTTAYSDKTFMRPHRFDSLLARRFPDLSKRYLEINDFSQNQINAFLDNLKEEKFAYLFVFKKLSSEQVKIVIPEWNEVIGTRNNFGNYESVLDIYIRIKEMRKDGLTASRTSLLRWFNLTTRNADTFNKFLGLRGLSYDKLWNKANVYLVNKEKYEKNHNQAALDQLEQGELDYEAALQELEKKWYSKEGITEKRHLDEEGKGKVSVAMLGKRKVPPSTSLNVPGALKEIPSIKKTKIPAENAITTTQTTEISSLVGTTLDNAQKGTHAPALFGKAFTAIKISPAVTKKRLVADSNDEQALKHSRKR
jgi:hypothetical protein